MNGCLSVVCVSPSPIFGHMGKWSAASYALTLIELHYYRTLHRTKNRCWPHMVFICSYNRCIVHVFSEKVFFSWNSGIDSLKAGTNKGDRCLCCVWFREDSVEILCFRVGCEDRLDNIISSLVVKYSSLLWLSIIGKQFGICVCFIVSRVSKYRNRYLSIIIDWTRKRLIFAIELIS